MDGVVALGECMVELSLSDDGAAAIGYAGDVFNTAVYLARLGVRARFATALGDGDPFSAAILQRMQIEGVGDQLVTRVPGRLPGLYAIERDANGERRFFYWREQAPVRQIFDLADLDGLTAAFRRADLVYVSGITLAVIGEAGRSALLSILADVASHGVPVAFDPNYRARLWPSREVAEAATLAVVPLCRVVSASGPDVEDLCQRPLSQVAADWAALGPSVIARSEDRTVEVHADGRVRRLAAPPVVAAVDTTGAGDSFNAGLLASWLRGDTLEHAVACGHRLASHVVQYRGAITPATAMPPPDVILGVSA